MRHITELLYLFPDKTGKELLEIQEQDKVSDKKAQEKRDKKLISLMNDININGGYYKGSFGTGQYYMYKFTDVKLQSGKLYSNAEKIIMFYEKNLKTSLSGRDMLDFKIEPREFVDLLEVTKYTERIKEEEYYNLFNLLNLVIPSFFKKEFKIRQKEFGK